MVLSEKRRIENNLSAQNHVYSEYKDHKGNFEMIDF